ncbi:hypothetical protein [Ichthyenterobacterium magnum]|uniref:Uncharacterized protein n=1 Tax=Ichthyenterobacterium magnum TaxID=1230530 RepID=A0A420DMH4_9FLAO|nr:hypothetical protein [Ichthyenterobacterium magnum]RKE95443.1 hypothetical protein BXY80_1630 [Ichthyenterobacterium magnum]
MKNLLKTIAMAMVIFSCYNCSVEPTDNQLENNQTATELSVSSDSDNLCAGDLPKIKLTNNGTYVFDVSILGFDSVLLASQGGILVNNHTGWIELSVLDVVVVANNPTIYGQKIELNLELCDNLELEIDSNNELIISDAD